MAAHLMHQQLVDMEPNQRKSADHKARPFVPKVIELGAARSNTSTKSRGAIVVLVSTAASGYILQIKESLLAGHITVMELIRRTVLFNSSPAGENSDRFMIRVQISYRQKRLANLIFRSRCGICGAEVPFCGDSLVHDDFAVSVFAKYSNAPALDALVIIQPPPRSELERELTRQLPVDLSEMDDRLFLADRPPLLVMDGGWALGAYLANIAALQMQRHRQKTESRPHSAAGLNPGCAARGCSPDKHFDLTLPADDLLHVYRETLKKRIASCK